MKGKVTDYNTKKKTLTVEMDKPKSTWKSTLEYLNKFDVGDEIKRESLLLAIGGVARIYNTVDMYRLILCKLGYMNYNTPYKILKKIPTTLVYNQCKMEAYKIKVFA